MHALMVKRFLIGATGVVALVSLTACGFSFLPPDDKAVCEALYFDDGPDSIQSVIGRSSGELRPALEEMLRYHSLKIVTGDDNERRALAMDTLGNYCVEIGAW